MNREEARVAMMEQLRRRDVEGAKNIVIIDSETIEKPYGWIFYYDSRRYLETGDIRYKIFGHGPVVVIAATGEIIELGSARPSEEFIKELEEERHLL